MSARALPRLGLAAVLLAATAAGGPVAAAPDSKPAVGNGGLTPAEVAARTAVERWLAAQNRGRFDDYAALYAPSFRGLKRVGKTAKKMDRAAWLKDRKAMFKALMAVTAAEVKVTLPPPGAATGPVVELTQTWAAGAFADTGLKRITFDAAGALIVAEEMVSSRVMLTEAACLTTLFPGASIKQRRTNPDDGARRVAGLSVLDLGGRWACKVEVEREDGIDAVVAVLAFGKRWELRGRLDLDYPVSSTGDESEPSTEGGEVTFERLDLHASIPTLAVTREVTRSGNEWGKTESTTTVYRADGADLTEVLAYESAAATGEADDLTRCVLELGTKRSEGWLDLAVGCTHSEVQWAAGENQPKESRETTRYRWDGATYAER